MTIAKIFVLTSKPDQRGLFSSIRLEVMIEPKSENLTKQKKCIDKIDTYESSYVHYFLVAHVL